jgi:hypothetical protein
VGEGRELSTKRSMVEKNNSHEWRGHNSKSGFTTLTAQLSAEHHDKLLDGHFWTERIYLSLHRRYFWPLMAHAIAIYMRGCDICHHLKPTDETSFDNLDQLDIPSERWSRTGIDFITKLPVTNLRYDCIVSIIDHLTSGLNFYHQQKRVCQPQLFCHNSWNSIWTIWDSRYYCIGPECLFHEGIFGGH